MAACGAVEEFVLLNSDGIGYAFGNLFTALFGGLMDHAEGYIDAEIESREQIEREEREAEERAVEEWAEELVAHLEEF